MTEMQKAHAAFEAAILKLIRSSEISMDRKVRKAMNAVGPDGTEYQTEEEIQVAYAYEDITDAERYRLLKALEYKADRPRLKEDYVISLCRKALRLVDSEKHAVAQETKKWEIRGKEAEIKRNGGTPLLCACCGDVVGETDRNGHRTEYLNCKECRAGRVCKQCLRMCPGQCKHK